MKIISKIFATLLIRFTGILKHIRFQVILILSILLLSGSNVFIHKKTKIGTIHFTLIIVTLLLVAFNIIKAQAVNRANETPVF
jgi:hypothetical protein